jgi:hypothetical protein
MKRNGSWIRSARRYAIYHRDSFRCAWCLADLSETHGITLDHLASGSHESCNLVTACMQCNSLRGATPLSEMLQVIPKEQGDALLARVKQDVDLGTGRQLAQTRYSGTRGPAWYSRLLALREAQSQQVDTCTLATNDTTATSVTSESGDT